MGFLFFLPLAFDKFHNVWMPNLERLHLGSPSSLASGFYNCRDLIVNSHERERSAWLTSSRKLFTAAANRRKIGPSTRTELEQHGFAGCEAHDVLHVVIDTLDKTCGTLWILVRVLRLLDLARLNIVVPIALRTGHIVLLIQANVKPNGRIEGAVLVQAQPAQVTIESFAIFRSVKVTVCDAPIRYRASNTMDQLPNRSLALVDVRWITVEVLADNYVGRQLAPVGRDFAIGLFEEHFAALVFNRSAASFPLNGIERACHIRWAEPTLNLQSTAIAACFMRCARLVATFASDFYCCHSLVRLLEKFR